MAEQWTIEEPRVLDVGGEGERVRALKVGLVGGRVDVVTHDDSPAARIEVSDVKGQPVLVRWDGSTLKISQGRDSESGIVDRLRATFEGIEHNRVVISVSIPDDATATVSTVSADALVAGVHAEVKANTVSGALTLDDLIGRTSVNTVSGIVECSRLRGPLHANSVSGTVTAQSSELPEATVHTVSGDVALDLTNAVASVSSNSVTGDVTVRAPHRGYDVRANTAGGQVVVDGRELRRGPYASGGQLTEGDRALRIKANAVSGSIVVLRSDTRSTSAGTTDEWAI
jgi:DUF4097 and DUF4098 domain-containing protein YvlB